MAKAADKTEATPQEETPVATKPEAAAAPQAPAAQVQVEDGGAISLYANFCRVTGTPEELIIDFGLNRQPMGIPKDPIQVCGLRSGWGF